jgi:hypothetical protein
MVDHNWRIIDGRFRSPGAFFTTFCENHKYPSGRWSASDKEARLEAILSVFPPEREYTGEAESKPWFEVEADELRARSVDRNRNDSSLAADDRLFKLARKAVRIFTGGKDCSPKGMDFDDLLEKAVDVISNEKMTRPDGGPLLDNQVIRRILLRLRRASAQWRTCAEIPAGLGQEEFIREDSDSVVGSFLSAPLPATAYALPGPEEEVEVAEGLDGIRFHGLWKVIAQAGDLTEADAQVIGGLLDGWKQKDIAKGLGISQSAVSQALLRLRKRMTCL